MHVHLEFMLGYGGVKFGSTLSNIWQFIGIWQQMFNLCLFLFCLHRGITNICNGPIGIHQQLFNFFIKILCPEGIVMFIKGLQSLLADVYFFLTIYFIGQRNLLNNGDGLKDSVIRCLNFDAYIAKPAGSPRNI